MSDINEGKDILMKYAKIGLDGLQKAGESVAQELQSVSLEDVQKLSKEEFEKIPLPLFYDWARITGVEEIYVEAKINSFKSVEEKFEMFKNSELYSWQFEDILETIVAEQRASASMLQRLYQISFPKAIGYINELLRFGIIERVENNYNVLVSEGEYRKLKQ